MLTPVPLLSAHMYGQIAPILNKEKHYTWYHWKEEGILCIQLKYHVSTPIHTETTAFFIGAISKPL